MDWEASDQTAGQEHDDVLRLQSLSVQIAGMHDRRCSGNSPFERTSSHFGFVILRPIMAGVNGQNPFRSTSFCL
jgi:hypothetical protein